MKKQFQDLEISVVYFTATDVITTSGEDQDITGDSYYENELPVLPF